MSGGDLCLTFSDGEPVCFPAVQGESVLGSAERAGNRLASECRKGICRTCMARTDAGNEVLLCQLPAEPGFRARLPYRRVDITQPTLRRAKINAFRRVSASVWEIRYRLQFPLPFLPGQYVEALFPGIDKPRRFSMANSPDAHEHVFYVRDLPQGATGAYLANRAKAEDAFTVRGPFGMFYLRGTAAPKLFVTGGSGLAPVLSMLSTLRPGSCPPLVLVAGFSSPQEAFAIDGMKELANRLPLELVLASGSLATGWGGRIGNPIEAIDDVRSIPLACGTEAYLCGPPAMVRAGRDALVARGLDRACVFNEEFSQ